MSGIAPSSLRLFSKPETMPSTLLIWFSRFRDALALQRKRQRKSMEHPFIRVPTVFLRLPFCRSVVHTQTRQIFEKTEPLETTQGVLMNAQATLKLRQARQPDLLLGVEVGQAGDAVLFVVGLGEFEWEC